MKKIILLLVTALSISHPLSAHATGGGIRGGGAAKFLNGKWLLKDLFRQNRMRGESFTLSNDFRAFIKEEVIPIVETYSGAVKSNFWLEVIGDNVDVRFVNDLKEPCGGSDADHKSDSEIHYGCTIDGITYLHRANYGKLPTTLQKALAVIHQRAHAFDPSESAHDWIEPFIQGLATALEVRAEQEQGQFKRLSGQQVKNLGNLLMLDFKIDTEKSARRLGKGSARSFRQISAQGGGIIATNYSDLDKVNWISENSFLGIRSVYTANSETCFDARLKSGLPVIDQGTRVIDSSLECVQASNTNFNLTTVTRVVSNVYDGTFGLTSFFNSSVAETNWRAQGSLSMYKSTFKKVVLVSDVFRGGHINDSHLNKIFLKAENTQFKRAYPITLSNRTLSGGTLEF